MSDLPPKVVKAQLVRLDDSLKQIERKQVAGIQRAPGSLPVLEAFQAFLEHERKVARRRMLALTAFALLLMLGIAGAGIVLVQNQMRKTAADFSQAQSRTDALATSVAALEQQKNEELKALELKFSDESQRIVNQYQSLLETQTTTLSGKITAGDTAIESFGERLTRLETENEALKARLTEVATAQQAIPKALPDENASKVASNSGLAAESGTTAGTEPATGERPAALLVTIIPKGQTQGIRWMLPPHFTQE